LPEQTVTVDPTAAAVLPLYDAFARRDLGAALVCMAGDIAWHEAEGLPWGGLKIGRAAVAGGVFTPALRRIPDLLVTPIEIVSSGARLYVIQRYTGTAEATGAALDVTGVGVWDVGDGRITRYRQFVDTKAFCAALG
jgi:ketosteroid isomerase-like protein